MSKQIEKPHIFKVVLILGENHPEKRVAPILGAIKQNPDQILVLGDGEAPISELELTIPRGSTNKDTLFIVMAHGSNKFGDVHKIGQKKDNIETASFLRKLQATVDHDLTTYLSSCYGGLMLKKSGVQEKIDVLSMGSKYVSLLFHALEIVRISILKRCAGTSTTEIFSLIIGAYGETFYYSKDGEMSKFSRPGKFSLAEIEGIIDQVYLEDDELAQNALQKFKEVPKESFSLNKIIEILDLKEPFIDKQTELLGKFREALQEKLKPENMAEFLEARRQTFLKFVEKQLADPKEEEEIKEGDLDAKHTRMLDRFWFIAANRGYEEEMMAMLQNNPELLNKLDKERSDALISVASKGKLVLGKKLIELGAALNNSNCFGMTPLIMAANKGQEDFAKFLIDKQMDEFKTLLIRRDQKKALNEEGFEMIRKIVAKSENFLVRETKFYFRVDVGKKANLPLDAGDSKHYSKVPVAGPAPSPVRVSLAEKRKLREFQTPKKDLVGSGAANDEGKGR